MSDLAAFLRARLDEDKRIAREAGSTAVEGEIVGWHVPDWPDDCCRVEGDNITIYDEGGHDRPQALHIARWDPVRVLAEVEAKRRILKEHPPDQYWPPDKAPLQCERCSDVEGWNPVAYPCLTARMLALPYADHPDYDPAWAPESEVTTD